MNTEIKRTEISPSCEVCHCTESLKTCSRCHGAFYCSRDHQVLHWTNHKHICKNFRDDSKSVNSGITPAMNSQFISLLPQPAPNPTEALATWNSGNYLANSSCMTENKSISPAEQTYSELKVNNRPIIPYDTTKHTLDPSCKAADSSKLQINDDLLALTAEYLLSENFSVNNTEHFSLGYDLSSVTEQIFDNNSCTSQTLSAGIRLQEMELACSMPFGEVCKSIVHDLNVHGICVMDKFLGSEIGQQILTEVNDLFQQGIFQKGQVMNSDVWKSTKGIRGDLIFWVSGIEPGCEIIGSLIRRLDDVMNRCSKMKSNGILSRYKLNKRTKAMIACYPGDGTHYKKHIDNPDGDGRCITCIYYLNKDWDVEKHGGMLRMFPTGHEDEIANIEPIFDRMLFFWSDRRNPHEVLPSYNVRFAITVWYFDSDERQLALIKSSLQQKP